jgi:hypothetical protein
VKAGAGVASLKAKSRRWWREWIGYVEHGPKGRRPLDEAHARWRVMAESDECRQELGEMYGVVGQRALWVVDRDRAAHPEIWKKWPEPMSKDVEKNAIKRVERVIASR